MPTSKLTGLGDKFNRKDYRLNFLFRDRTVRNVRPNYYADFAHVRSVRRSWDGLHVDLRFENPYFK